MFVCFPLGKTNKGTQQLDIKGAAAIFIGPTLEAEDNRRDYGEVRVQAIGSPGDDILSVVYSDRGDVRRIISARLANRKERKLWHSFIEHWNKSTE